MPANGKEIALFHRRQKKKERERESGREKEKKIRATKWNLTFKLVFSYYLVVVEDYALFIFILT